MMWWNGYEGWGFGLLHMLGFWIFLAVLLVILFRGFELGTSRRDSISQRRESPLDILKTRYAKGEIDVKEFEERKRTLAS